MIKGMLLIILLMLPLASADYNFDFKFNETKRENVIRIKYDYCFMSFDFQIAPSVSINDAVRIMSNVMNRMTDCYHLHLVASDSHTQRSIGGLNRMDEVFFFNMSLTEEELREWLNFTPKR